ncbi:MOSC domain-containing protein [Massilia sp. LXY-6]|uniref:MOSC domain-containing protein n=1 Tax=Massilia sp. LXY-6 TaxID=3379823 RepID=UPI003EE299F1
MSKGVEAGRVLALALRAAHSPSSTPAPYIEAIAGTGLAGDRHANPLSPRQVLLASASVYADLTLPAHALGENLLVDFDTATLHSGTVLQVGSTVLLRLMFQCEACGYLDGYLPGVSARIGRRRGILARVLAGGAIDPGDRILDLGCVMPAWDDDWRERVAQVLRTVPDGMVLTYARLALLAGVQPTYCRAFPRLVARLGPGHAGKAVPAHAAAGRRCWDGQGLFGDAAYKVCSS